jgi:hypothetical protein
MCVRCKPGRPLYRCACCYKLFSDAITARMEQVSQKSSFPLSSEPVFKALLSAPWEELATTRCPDEATRLLVQFSSVLEVSSVQEGERLLLRWKTRCPCCFDMKVLEPEWVIDDDFADAKPKVIREKVVLPDCLVLDDSTGAEVTKTILVHICTVTPVVSNEIASQFKFCSPDGAQHVGYELIIPEMPAGGSDVYDEVWQLVRSSGPGSRALSFNRIGCLDSLFGDQTNPRSGCAAARRIGTLLRRAAPYRASNSRKAPATVDMAINRRGLRGSSLRVNRVGGPNGHGGGFSLQELKAMVCSPYISHCIPRNSVDSVIIWPVASGGRGSGITEIIPFYVTVKMEKGLSVTCPPHCAIPRHGFSSTGTRVLTEFQRDEITQPQKPLRPVEFLRIFTVTPYNGARILLELGKMNPSWKTSEEAALRTLASERSRRTTYSAGAVPPSLSTRSRSAGERDSYSPGQAVFVLDSNPDSDATWPALVVEEGRCNSDGKQYHVKFDGDPNDYIFPVSRMLPDAFGDKSHRGDDDDVVRANFASNDKLVADRGLQSKNFLDVLTELGEFTTVFDSIFGHQDNFTHTDGALLENKSSFPQGLPDRSVKMEDFFSNGTVPPGALAYPMYKVATLSFALSDVELHCLDKDLHCSPRQLFQEDANKRSRRGAWTRVGEELIFYPEGYALLDWNSRNNHAGGAYHGQLRRSSRNVGNKKSNV